MRRRDDLMKITEVLIRAKTENMPTRLMSNCRISYDPFMALIERLLKVGLLELVPGIAKDRRHKMFMYRTTDQGIEFIDNALMCYLVIEDEYIKNLLKKVRNI